MENDNMERQLQVATDIARLQQTVEDLGNRLDTGFERMTGAWERIEGIVTRHDYAIQQLQTAETKRVATRAGAVKWLAGIASAVVVALLMMVFGLRR